MRKPESANALAARAPRALTFRTDLRQQDIADVRSVTAATGFFLASEVDVAVELVEAAFNKGATSGYSFLLAEQNGAMCGYTCFGSVPCTEASFDLYCIVIAPVYQRQGIGNRLLLRTEELIHDDGGRQVYAETSSSA
ncbi:MAG: GNAT family N-acetyltransferase [Gammaproteobacteria bacterium]|nr:GNAT family N-acetyltransferase [Gammaproteobacteria bacterium]MBA3732577.1 GNAT family N-acetyltransferase [Gammaproteobacteria bacterium]